MGYADAPVPDDKDHSLLYKIARDVSAAGPSGGGLTDAQLRATPVPVSNTPLTDFGAGDYETVAAGVSDQILGPTGAAGDWLAGLLIIPGTTSPGAVSVKDGNGSAISVFAGGASSVSNLVPFFVPFGAKTVNGTTPGWKVTTGANVTAIGFGNFT